MVKKSAKRNFIFFNVKYFSQRKILCGCSQWCFTFPCTTQLTRANSHSHAQATLFLPPSTTHSRKYNLDVDKWFFFSKPWTKNWNSMIFFRGVREDESRPDHVAWLNVALTFKFLYNLNSCNCLKVLLKLLGNAHSTIKLVEPKKLNRRWILRRDKGYNRHDNCNSNFWFKFQFGKFIEIRNYYEFHICWKRAGVCVP